MNTVGNKGLGESVWLGWFLASVLEMISPICAKDGAISEGNRISLVNDGKNHEVLVLMGL